MNFSDLKVFFRTLLRNRLYTVVTVAGFSVSLAFMLLLGMYIRQELSVDGFQEKKDRIFRMTSEDGALFGALVGEQLKGTFPDIEAYTRVYAAYGNYGEGTDGRKLPMQMLYADPDFLKMFSFPLQQGRGMEARNEVVLSLSFARKLFGEEEVVGKELKMNGGISCVVTGVMPDLPENTHFNRFDVLADFRTLSPSWISNNNSCSFGLYLLAREGSDLEAKVPLMLGHLKKDFWMYRDGYRKELLLEPLESVYWSPRWGTGARTNSRTFITALIGIVGVILALSLINYTNLSVARTGFRARESAVKKLLGSNNRALFRQYICESVILCFLSFAFACCLATVLLPWFNDMLGTHLVLQRYLAWQNLTAVAVAVALIGLLAGIAPAWMVMRFNPVEVVKGAFRRKNRGVYGKALIAFQYMTAIALIICTLVIWKQTDFMRTYDLGFDKENVVWLESKVDPVRKEALRDELSRIPGVETVSFAYGTPLDGGDNNTITDYNGTGKQISFQRFEVDEEFFRVLDLQVTPTGAAYDPAGVWLNETAARAIGDQELPKEIMFFTKKLPVLGIIKDFHTRNLTAKIGPVIVLTLQPDLSFSKVLVKVSSENPAGTFDQIKHTYGRFVEGVPFESGFMDRTIDSWYESNARTARLVGYFAVLAVVLCMMGILAMATYFIQQRVKEIGVRRVNGATVGEILRMLMNSFMRWIALAFVVACPLGWYVMSRWLQDFPYRTDLSWWLYAVAGLSAFTVAALMVGWQSLKAASENPVNTLKNE